MNNLNFFKKKINQNNLFCIIILSIFSIGTNQYYASFGVFPHDSFSHFETGNMILNGYHPFKDFWIVSGPFIDYFQSFLFFIFGTNWKTYVFHASLINLLITLFTFFTLRKFELNFNKSLFFSICFCILAYPSSGTPFVDHHSAFFSLMGIYSILICIQKESKLLSFLIPVFFILAFLSKQVPSSYLAVGVIPVFLCYLYLNKKIFLIPPFLYGSVSLSSALLIFGYINGIRLENFIEQYFLYPQSIASARFQNFNISILGIIGNFKFIFVSLIILILVSTKPLLGKKVLKNKNFYINLILIISALMFIFHQILTRNQIFIFFLIPIIIGFANISIRNRVISYLTILFCLIATIKFHERFNEGRKFHELQNINFNKTVDAKIIHKKLNGLKWITPQFKNDPLKEIKIINDIKDILIQDKRKKMVLGNYSFLSVITKENFHSTTRWHVLDGSDYPLPSSKYFKSYKNLVYNVIKKNKIEVIYSIRPVRPQNIYSLFNKACLQEIPINNYFTKFELSNCIK